MQFKVDSSTVGSLLDDTNARNWRDALLQVWMISPKIDNQSFPFFMVLHSRTISNPKPKWHFERPYIAKDRLQPPSEQDNVGEEELTTSTSPPKATKEKPDSAEVR